MERSMKAMKAFQPLERRPIRAALGLLLLLLFSVCSGKYLFFTTVSAESVSQMNAAQTPAPAVSTPPQFQSLETLPPKSKQLINPQKATYERLGFNKEEKKAFEESIAQDKTFPIICVTTDNGEYILSRTVYSSCVIDVFNCPEAWVLDEASAGIRIRGNSSAYYGNEEKIMQNPVPYRIKFDKKTNLLGLNNGAKAKSWVLLKAGYDLIRNDLALRLGRTIMAGHAFCSDAAYVHLYVNDVYQGVYTLCEQCQTGVSRVNITEPTEGYRGIDIGYYMMIDNNPEYPNSFIVDYGKHEVTDIEGDTAAFVKTAYTINSDVYTQGQIDFIKQYTVNVFEIVYQACEQSQFLSLDGEFNLAPSSFDNAQDTVEAVLDIDSVVNMYLLYEIMHDYDVGEGSFYMCVDFAENSACPKLQFTSPWDFNWTCEGRTDRYWAGAFCEESFVEKYKDRANPWFIVLIKQDWFRDLVKQKWTELADGHAISACLEKEISILETYENDFRQYKKSGVRDANKVLAWIKERLNWMDTQFLIDPPQQAAY